ncbi:hypothetical protein DRE_06565 [Drechslerella stenobrocha 248]|uniref:Uncharacterized protein n=1 Tax=Drechslerella stenobrocha 248 TaxID=1043628 RepID=W7HNE4_9PEZI|nr:hypothetical protein DRE_06565 [Drechslerella stenobrocha 248]
MAPPLIARPVQRRQDPSDVPFRSIPLGQPTAPARPSEDISGQPTAEPSLSASPSLRRFNGAPSPTVQPTPTPSSSSNNGGITMNGTQQGIVIAIVAVIATIILFFLTYVILKSIRLRYKDPKYLPGSWLKNKWQNWDVMGYQATPNASNPTQARINRVARSRANIEANRALDRQNSVRSVITLPPYREMAEMDLERTIGREGERDGLDTIVSLPETAEQEEERREERMQAMYELRLQRRAQRAAREARNSGSVTSLGQTSTNTGSGNASGTDPNATTVSLTAMDMEAGGSGRTASELTAAILNDRTRRLSEVAYAEVGYARHDGSRIRETSSNRNSRSNAPTDSQPLLSDSSTGQRRTSHTGSMFSLNTNVSGGRESTDRRDSTEILTGGDIGNTRLPPSYDGLDWGDAPPYMSPVSPVSRTDTAASRRSRFGEAGGELCRW